MVGVGPRVRIVLLGVVTLTLSSGFEGLPRNTV